MLLHKIITFFLPPSNLDPATLKIYFVGMTLNTGVVGAGGFLKVYEVQIGSAVLILGCVGMIATLALNIYLGIRGDKRKREEHELNMLIKKAELQNTQSKSEKE